MLKTLTMEAPTSGKLIGPLILPAEETSGERRRDLLNPSVLAFGAEAEMVLVE